ncbi:MAG TPA: 1-acyl-sn-glycerol-3-phosphate acyltransferase, partial [Desulfuromonadales bacterium]|nr:1-acyl-sn-glycerol-3-phosphate acyltransferase [Desulfuromonadales bacterium]
MLRTLVAIAVFIPWTLFVIVTGIPLSFVSPDYFHNYARIWARFGLWLTAMHVEVEGAESLVANRPVIYMANHQSNFDILA